MSISTAITSISQHLTDAYDAIDDKGGTIPTDKNMANLEDAVRSISGGSPQPVPLPPVYAAEYYAENRPDDWLPMPECGENEIYLLYHIPESPENVFEHSFRCSVIHISNYGYAKIEFGTVVNGEFSAIEKYTQIQDRYNHPSVELDIDDFGNTTADGFRQCMIKISKNSGSDIQSCSYTAIESFSANYKTYRVVEAVANLPNGTGVSGLCTKYTEYINFSCGGKSSADTILQNCSGLKAVLHARIGATGDVVGSMKNAFNGCSSLEALPEEFDLSHATSMEDAFSGCKSIQSISISDSSNITTLLSAFASCSSLQSLSLGGSAPNCKSASGMASGCSSLQFCAMPNDLSAVTAMNIAFYNCAKLLSLELPDLPECTTLKQMCYGCTSLETFTIGETPKCAVLGDSNNSGAFQGCKAIKNIVFENLELCTDFYAAFLGCSSLETLTLGGLSQDATFKNMCQECISLRSFSLPNYHGCTDMSGAFSGCSSLETFEIGGLEKCTTMQSAFYNCSNLQSFSAGSVFSELTTLYAAFSGCISLRTLSFSSLPKLVTLGSSTAQIVAFYNCKQLRSLTLPDLPMVTSLQQAFNSCEHLQTVAIGETPAVTTAIGAFSGCYWLEHVTLSDTTENWAGTALNFSQCALGHDAIIALFNSLPTITSSKTLTLTGNPGVSELTDAEKEIATDKHWTLAI